MSDDIRYMLEAKRQLLLAVSHELRSPLTRARINAELLSDFPATVRWTLSVRDSRPGVSLEQVERLTDPFFRADESRQRGSGGVGLGLYLSRAIAEAHGGSLVIESAPGHGTEVLASIPVASDG